MDLSFSVDLHDHEGDVYDECILIHVGESAIIKFKSYAEVVAFSDTFRGMLPELRENLPLERQAVESPKTAPTSAMVPCCVCGESVTINKQKYHCQKCFDKLTAQHQ